MPAHCYVTCQSLRFFQAQVLLNVHCWFCDGFDQAHYILADEVQSIRFLIARFISAGFSDIEH